MDFKRALRLAPLASIAAIVTTLIPVTAAAQSTAPYTVREQVIRGTITRFDGAYTMYVRDARGNVDRITLRQGTIINPTGIRLSEGQGVTVIGFARGNALVANQIDTLYAIQPPAYTYAPPPPGVYAPLPGVHALPPPGVYAPPPPTYPNGFPTISIGFGLRPGPYYGWGWRP